MNKLLFRGQLLDLGKKAVVMPKWQQLLDQAEEAGKGKDSAYTKSVWANRCIDLRANLLSRIEWRIASTADDDAEPLLEDHPLVVMLQEFNPEANWRDALRATDADLNIYGAAYWLKGKGWLQRLNPSTMEVDADADGLKGFIQRDLGTGKPRPFKREEIVYFHLYDPRSDLTGYSPSMAAAEAIETEYQANLWLADFFKNYAIPPILLSAKEQIGQEEANRIKNWWNDTFGGRGKRHRVGVVDQGMEAKILGYPIKELAMDMVRENARREICAAYGVPMSMVGAWSEAYQAASEKERESVYTETILPRAQYLADVINAELIPDPYEFQWSFDELEALQENETDKAERMAILVRAGIATVEYAAEQLGIPEDQRGEGPQAAFGFGNSNADEEREAEQRGPNPFEKALMTWQTKAMKTFKKNGNAECWFESKVIPMSLNAAIEGSLRAAKDERQVKDIFLDALAWANYKHA